MTDSTSGEKGREWHRVALADSAWSALVVPEGEGFGLVMPTWAAEQILADRNALPDALAALEAALYDLEGMMHTTSRGKVEAAIARLRAATGGGA